MALFNRIAQYADEAQFLGTDASAAALSLNYQNFQVVRPQVAAKKTVVTLEITHKVTANGNIVMLDGGIDSTVVSIAVVTTDTLEGIATKIAAGTYAKMTVTRVGAVLTLTAATAGNLPGVPGIYTYPAGLTYTESVFRGSSLDSSMKETRFALLSSADVEAGNVSVYYNAAIPVVTAIDAADTLAQAIAKIVADCPTTHTINVGPVGSGIFIIQNKTAGDNADVIQETDWGTTGIVAASYRGFDWEQGNNELGTCIISFENEHQECVNAYKDDHILVTQAFPSIQLTEVWNDNDFKLFWVAQ